MLFRSKRPCRPPTILSSGWTSSSAILAGAILVAGPLVWAQVATPPGLGGRPDASPDETASPVVQDKENRVREGTELNNVLGYFTVTGSRVTFVTGDNGTRFAGLENLNLERISRMISKAPKQMDWEVSGEVTEYRGANYLLVSRAVLKTGSSILKDDRR